VWHSNYESPEHSTTAVELMRCLVRYIMIDPRYRSVDSDRALKTKPVVFGDRTASTAALKVRLAEGKKHLEMEIEESEEDPSDLTTAGYSALNVLAVSHLYDKFLGAT
jgi:hypothetical protein